MKLNKYYHTNHTTLKNTLTYLKKNDLNFRFLV